MPFLEASVSIYLRMQNSVNIPAVLDSSSMHVA